MLILVCGGRDYYDRDFLFQWMDGYIAEQQADPVEGCITGGARGADALARDWAYSKGIQTVECAANWQHFGKKAGWTRNYAMAYLLEPSIVIAFPGGRGTDMMIEIAGKFDIPVLRPV